MTAHNKKLSRAIARLAMLMDAEPKTPFFIVSFPEGCGTQITANLGQASLIAEMEGIKFRILSGSLEKL